MLVVKTLGKFQVMNSNGSVDESTFRSVMLSKLFIYVLLHRDQVLFTEDLAAALWQEDESDNPAGALKNLMYRLRSLLNERLGEADYILTGRGSYQWNPEIPVLLDVEQFTDYINQAVKLDPDQVEEKIKCLEKGIELYRGPFFPKIMDMPWALVQSTHCLKEYMKAVMELETLYLETGNYVEMETLALEALKQDAINEQLHYYLIVSRARMGKLKNAVEAYESALNLLYRELGIRNSELLEEAHEEVLNQNVENEVAKLSEAHQDLREEEPDGVFFVPYDVFKSIYQLEARKASRIGIAEYILMFTVDEAETDSFHDAEQVREQVSVTMEALYKVLSSSLRLGDVATKFSASQYIVLLPNCNYENSLLVANRILDKFYKGNRKLKDARIKMSVEELMR